MVDGHLPEEKKFFARYFTGSDLNGAPDSFHEATFLENLIFSEELVHQSHWFKEFDKIIELIGIDGFIELINKRVLTVHADAQSIGQIGQTAVLNTQPVPIGRFRFAGVRIAKWQESAEKRFDEFIAKSPHDKKALKRLKYFVLQRVSNFQSMDIGLATQRLEADLVGDPEYVKLAVCLAASEFGKTIRSDKFDLKFEAVNEKNTYRAITNLRNVVGISPEEEHKIIERGALGVGGIYQQLQNQAYYDSAIEFGDRQIALLEQRLSRFQTRFSPGGQSARLMRVMEIAGLPDLSLVTKIDVGKLIELKKSSEYREFVVWLNTQDLFSPKELNDRISSFSQLVQRALNSKIGRVLRWAVPEIADAMGTPKASMAGKVFGAADAFILDRFQSNDRLVYFLKEKLPLVFIRPSERDGQG